MIKDEQPEKHSSKKYACELFENKFSGMLVNFSQSQKHPVNSKAFLQSENRFSGMLVYFLQP